MGEILGGVFLVAGVLLPIAAFLWIARRPTPTASSLVIASTLVGAFVGTCFLIVSVIADSRLLFDPALHPWWLVFTSWGFLIGVAGVLGRLLRRG